MRPSRLSKVSSDSSMDDKDLQLLLATIDDSGVQIPLWTIRTRQSPVDDLRLRIVQIPLWTIRTRLRNLAGRPWSRSDSSMDDKDLILT